MNCSKMHLMKAGMINNNMAKMTNRMNKMLVILLFIVFVSCSKLTDNNIQKEIPSPSGNHTAIVFSRDAGATTAFNTQVSIIDSDKQLPDSPGNIFISDRMDDINIYWTNEKELHIVLPGMETRIYKKEESFEGIVIVYQ